jgi:hypothetical protein
LVLCGHDSSGTILKHDEQHISTISDKLNVTWLDRRALMP